jgi:hypothetical protein
MLNSREGFNLPPSAASDAPVQPEKKKSGFWDFFSKLNPFKSGRQEKKSGTDARSRAASRIGFEEMERALLAKQQVTEDDLRTLVRARAQTVETYLVDVGHLAPDRIGVAAAKVAGAAASGESQVTLALK